MYNISPLIYPVDGGEYGVYALYPSVERELKEILNASGMKEKCGAMFKQRLKYLKDNGENCYLHPAWFERYAKSDGIYAMKIKSDLNLRILFIFQNGKTPILIHAFLEKNKADTERAKEVYKERVANIDNMPVIY